MSLKPALFGRIYALEDEHLVFQTSLDGRYHRWMVHRQAYQLRHPLKNDDVGYLGIAIAWEDVTIDWLLQGKFEVW